MEDEKKKVGERNELAKIKKYTSYTLLAVLVGFWGYAAVKSIISLWNDEGFFATPWPTLGLILTGVIVVIVILPLYISIREDVKATLEAKEKN